MRVWTGISYCMWNGNLMLSMYYFCNFMTFMTEAVKVVE